MNRIKIDLERIISDIDRNIFGGYMEIGPSAARFKYLDIGDSSHADKNVLREDIRTAVERMNLSNIRFPGGNFASGYHWMDGVGPRQTRPSRQELAWNRVEPNNYGTNEFLRACRAFNIEPYLCVNCGDGDMREAADWVEYCNGTGETALVKLRREHGFTQPHKVKYWGIGNEVDSPHQIGYKTPQEYARAYTEFSKVMKRVDPNIKLVASAACSWEDRPLGPQFLYRKTEWVERAQLMLEQAGDRIDYMAIHRYAHPYYDDPFETYMAFAADFNEHLSAYEGLIHAVSLERGINHSISIAVDEWGNSPVPGDLEREMPISVARDELGVTRLTAGGRDRIRRRDRWNINLEDALVQALHFNTFIRHAYSVRMANLPSMPFPAMGINLIRLNGPVLLQPTFYPFEIYSRTCGQLALDVFWYGDTFSGTYKNRAYSGIRTLDVAATLDASRKQLVVYVINQSKNDAMDTTISLASGEFTGNMQVSVVNGPDIKSENTDENPNQVFTRESAVKVTGRSFNFTFEPHSVTALVCGVK
jgi:alpha-N-arabinofuranosidase